MLYCYGVGKTFIPAITKNQHTHAMTHKTTSGFGSGLMGPNNARINPVNADDRKVKSDTCMFIFDGETGKLKKAEVIDEA